MRHGVGGVVGLSAVALLFIRATTPDGLFPLPKKDTTRVTLHVTAQRAFWEIEHDAGPNEPRRVTRNVVHIPRGETVRVELRSRDVVHGFWVPGLSARKSVIPGRIHTSVLRARQTGTYRGLCDDSCGQQHADMSFTVIVQHPQEFRAWLSEERG